MHPLTGSRLRANDERFRLDAAAGVVSRPARPECPSVVPRRAQGVVVGACGLSVFFARPPVLSDRDDRSGAAREDGCTDVDCSIAIGLLTATLAAGLWRPAHRRIEPNRQGARLHQGCVVIRPAHGLVAWGCRLANAVKLVGWIHKVNLGKRFVQ